MPPGRWGRSLAADSYGNSWVNNYSNLIMSALTPTSGSQFNSNNQLTLTGMTYDSAGNQTATMSGVSLGYDAENRVVQHEVTGGNVRELYDYDGEGRRVRHRHQTWVNGAWTTPANSTTLYVYDAFGKLAAEYGAQSASSPCVTCYLTTDTLGSTRMVTDENGVAVARYDYLPFGQEILPPSPPVSGSRSSVLCGVSMSCYGQSTAVNQQFTGMEHDFDTGNDYFYARYYNRAEGRFTSADIPLLDQYPSDPQSWNLYGYVRNNPLVYVDLDGHMQCTDCGGGGGGVDWWDWCHFWGNCTGGNTGNQNNQPPGPPPTNEETHGVQPDINNTWSQTLSCNKSATQVMSAVQNDMNQFAKNRGYFFAANFPNQPIRMGARYFIQPGVNSHNGGEFPTGVLLVTVTSQSANGWTFTTDPSHHYFDGTVSFSSTDAGNGNITFSVTANANYSSPFWSFLGPIIKAGEGSTWNNMLKNVQSYCQLPVK
jgi:RHS repeat-associated protein